MSDVTTTAATTTPVTLAEAKRHLNITTTGDDTYVTDLLSAATVYCEDRTNQAFINQTRTMKMRGFYDNRYVHKDSLGRSVIYPERGPLSSVTSITYVDSQGTTQTLSSTAYDASSDNPARIAEAFNNTWPATRDQQDSVTVTYVAGHSSGQDGVPASVRHAIKLLTAHWYRNREAVGQVGNEISLGVDALLGQEHLEHYG